MAHYYFVGIAGIGMSALAQLVRAQGHAVSGSDRFFEQGQHLERRARLEAQGCRVFPQDGSGVTPEVTEVVISSAIEKGNADLDRAAALGLKTLHRSQLLADLFHARRRGIAVTGSFGKTTITGMIGWCLHSAGLKPMVVNGGIMRNFESDSLIGNACPGETEAACIEADESDGTCVNYKSSIGVITGLARDHKELDELQRIYAEFAANCRDALVVSPQIAALLIGRPGPRRVTFGLDGGIVRARQVRLGARDLRFNVGATRFVLRQIGDYSVFNALATIAALREMGVTDHSIEIGLRTFDGIGRRMELVDRVRKVRIYDDFAHNPSKVEAAVNAVRRAGARRVLGVFQLHGFGPARFMCNELVEVLARCLTREDRLCLLPIYYAGGTAARDISAEDIAEAARERGAPVRAVADRDALVAELAAEAAEGDTILVMGARDDTLTALCRALAAALENRAAPRAAALTPPQAPLP